MVVQPPAPTGILPAEGQGEPTAGDEPAIAGPLPEPGTLVSGSVTVAQVSAEEALIILGKSFVRIRQPETWRDPRPAYAYYLKPGRGTGQRVVRVLATPEVELEEQRDDQAPEELICHRQWVHLAPASAVPRESPRLRDVEELDDVLVIALRDYAGNLTVGIRLDNSKIDIDVTAPGGAFAYEVAPSWSGEERGERIVTVVATAGVSIQAGPAAERTPGVVPLPEGSKRQLVPRVIRVSTAAELPAHQENGRIIGTGMTGSRPQGGESAGPGQPAHGRQLLGAVPRGRAIAVQRKPGPGGPPATAASKYLPGGIPATHAEIRAELEQVAIAKNLMAARERVDEWERAYAGQVHHGKTDPDIDARLRYARDVLRRLDARISTHREKFVAEARAVALELLSASEERIVQVLGDYGLPAKKDWLNAAAGLVERGLVDAAVRLALRHARKRKNAQTMEAQESLAEAARELAHLQRRLAAAKAHRAQVDANRAAKARQTWQAVHHRQPAAGEPGGPGGPPGLNHEALDSVAHLAPRQEMTLPGAPAGAVRAPRPAPDMTAAPGTDASASLRAEVERYQADLWRAWLRHEQAHPILAAYRASNGDLANAAALMDADDGQLRAILHSVLPVLANLRRTRAAMVSGELKAHALPRVVAVTRSRLGIEANTLAASVAEEEARKAMGGGVADWAIVALSVGLAVLSVVPSGGGSLPLAAELAGVGVELYLARESVNEYSRAMAAAHTDFDQAHALASADPSRAGLAVDLVSAGVGGGLAGRALFKGAARATDDLIDTGRARHAALSADDIAVTEIRPEVLSRRLGVPVILDAARASGVRIETRVRPGRGGASFLEVVQVVVGHRAGMADVLAHADIIRQIYRYNGLLGSVRKLWDRMRQWVGGKELINPFPAGSIGHESWLEVQKYALMADARLGKLASPNLTPEQRAILEQEIAFLEGELAHHRRVVEQGMAEGSFQPGRGFIESADLEDVTAEALAKGYVLPAEHAERYYYRRKAGSADVYVLCVRGSAPAGTPAYRTELIGGKPTGRLTRANEGGRAASIPEDMDAEAVFAALLHGEDGGELSMKAFAEMLAREGIATRDELVLAIGGMQHTGTTFDTVRHKLKEKYRKQVMERMKGGTGAAMDESYLDMRRVTDDLAPSDAGNLAQDWYTALIQADDGRVRITEDVAKQHGIKLVRSREIDAVQGSTLCEVKRGTGALSSDDIVKAREMIRMAEKKLPIRLRNGDIRKAEHVRYVFLHPDGVKANRKVIMTWLKDYEGRFSIHVFNNSGESRILTQASDLPSLHSWLFGAQSW